MQFTVTFLSIIVLVVVVWILLETKKFKHKVLEIFIIFLILFTYFSFTFVLSGKNIDLSTLDGISKAGSIYFSWLGSVFQNLKTITTNAIRMNWSPQSSNSTINIMQNLTNITS